MAYCEDCGRWMGDQNASRNTVLCPDCLNQRIQAQIHDYLSFRPAVTAPTVARQDAPSDASRRGGMSLTLALALALGFGAFVVGIGVDHQLVVQQDAAIINGTAPEPMSADEVPRESLLGPALAGGGAFALVLVFSAFRLPK